MLVGVAGQVLHAPGGQGVDLDDLVSGVPTDQGRVGAGGGVLSAHSGGPRLVAAQGPGQWLDLAQTAAGGRVSRPQVRPVELVLLGHGQLGRHVDDGDVHGGGHRVAGAHGLREVVPGIQEEDVDTGKDPGDHVRQDGIGHGAGHGKCVGEVLDRPLDDVEDRGIVTELARAGLGQGTQLLRGSQRSPACALRLWGDSRIVAWQVQAHPGALSGYGAHCRASSSARCAHWAKVSSGMR